MPPILVIPGLGGSAEQHWQTHLQRSFAGAVRVQQDDWERPALARWTERLACAVEAQPGAVLVAHSLGCPLVAHLALRRPDLHIAAALLVAPADVDSPAHAPERIRGFAPIPLLRLPFRSIVVASTNDPFMMFTRARRLAEIWGAGIVDAGASGHINIEAGFGRWPTGERIVGSLISEHRAAPRLGHRRRSAALVAANAG